MSDLLSTAEKKWHTYKKHLQISWIIAIVSFALLSITLDLEGGIFIAVPIIAGFSMFYATFCTIFYHINRYRYDSYQVNSMVSSFRRGINKTARFRVIGMIKTEKTFDVVKASEMLGIQPELLYLFMYMRLGESKLEGLFITPTEFKVTSGMEKFVQELNSQFALWGKIL